MIKNTSIPSPQTHVASRILDGEAVLVHPVQGKVKVLNEVGAYVWSLLDGMLTVDQIVGRVCTQFAVDREIAERDIARFLESLLTRDLITFAQKQPSE